MTNKGVVGYPSSGVVPDGSIAPGKLAAPQGWGVLYTGRYYFTTSPGPTGTSATLGVGTVRVAPWFVPNSCTLSKLGGEVSSGGESGSKLRLGIYADDGTGYPGVLVLDAGTIAGDSATVQEISINQALPAGVYWVGGAVQVVSVTQPTVRVTNAGSGAFGTMNLSMGASTPSSAVSACGIAAVSAATGAFPQVFPAGASVTSAIPRMFVKVA